MDDAHNSLPWLQVSLGERSLPFSGCFVYIPVFSAWNPRCKIGFIIREAAVRCCLAVCFVVVHLHYNSTRKNCPERTDHVKMHLILPAKHLIQLLVIAFLLQIFRIAGKKTKYQLERILAALRKNLSFFNNTHFAPVRSASSAFAKLSVINNNSPVSLLCYRYQTNSVC